MPARFRQTILCLSFLVGLAFATDLLPGQEPALEPVAKVAASKPYDQLPPSEAEAKARREQQRQAKRDLELRARLENTVWNDVELSIGEPGYQWLLRIHKGKRSGIGWKRDWFLSERSQLPRVGSWDVKQEELLLIAPDGRVVARGKLDKNEEIIGQYYDPDRKHTYGSFHLIEESRRLYTIVPFRVIDPQAGK